MATLKRTAPIFPVRDVGRALEHYRRLGFATRRYDKGGYGFATRDGVEIHLGLVADGSWSGPASAYVWVDDADDLARAWSEAGADVRAPEDTEWGQHEGALVDPDGNIIRFGSRVTGSGTGAGHPGPKPSHG